MQDGPHFQLTLPAEPFLLAADIDGTMLGDEAGEAWMRAFRQECASGFLLAYITGRDFQSVLQLVAEGRLPPPDFIGGDVGSELLDCRDSRNFLGERYAAQVGPGWDLEAVYARGVGEGVRRQDFPEGQPRFQAGFDWDGQLQTLDAFYHRLANGDGFHILPSYNQYIDVLPDVLGKGKVVEFLQKELNLAPVRVVVAGDAGNDREMFDTIYKGILPSNALQELVTIACQPRHYQSPLPCARGVIDGLRHFEFIT